MDRNKEDDFSFTKRPLNFSDMHNSFEVFDHDSVTFNAKKFKFLDKSEEISILFSNTFNPNEEKEIKQNQITFISVFWLC